LALNARRNTECDSAHIIRCEVKIASAARPQPICLAWKWDGRPVTLIISRAVDEAGGVQPTLDEFRATRPPGNDYHNNYIRVWRVIEDGHVLFASGC
jgi:hypothetical protein